MKLLPYEDFDLIARLTPTQVTGRLKDNIIPRSRDIFRFNSDTSRPYEGYVDRNQFEMSRIIKYRNSFLPVIRGQIYQEATGSRIHIKMKMHSAVTVFMFVWMSGVTLALVAVLGDILSRRTFEPAIFFVLLMLVLGYGLTIGGFKYESTRSKNFLVDLLEANFDK